MGRGEHSLLPVPRSPLLPRSVSCGEVLFGRMRKNHLGGICRTVSPARAVASGVLQVEALTPQFPERNRAGRGVPITFAVPVCVCAWKGAGPALG